MADINQVLKDILESPQFKLYLSSIEKPEEREEATRHIKTLITEFHKNVAEPLSEFIKHG